MPEAADRSGAEHCDTQGNKARLRELLVLRDRQQLRRRVQQRHRMKHVSSIESHTPLKQKPK